MIFTQEQWQRVYDKHRGDDSAEATRPPELIMDIMQHDALEHGIHQDWIDFWNYSTDPESRWANTLFVMLFYPPHKFGERPWGKPRK